MADPVRYDLGSVRLRSGRVVPIVAFVAIELRTEGLEPGDRGEFLDDHFGPVLTRLRERLGRLEVQLAGFAEAGPPA